MVSGVPFDGQRLTDRGCVFVEALPPELMAQHDDRLHRARRALFLAERSGPRSAFRPRTSKNDAGHEGPDQPLRLARRR